MSPNKLSLEDRESLKDFVTSDFYKPLLKFLDLLLLDRQKALTDYDLSNGVEGLVSLKAEYEGAKKLLSSAKLNLQNIKKR